MSSFRIQTNVSALNAHRQLTTVSSALSKSMERLSSGYRINRAADDAAGLAIANRFRADIRSMQVAQRNIAEATSLVQIAEGAGSNIESILVRMKELATQAASANAGGQLASLDAEFQALIQEIDRTAAATNYQGTDLLDGSFSGLFQVGPNNSATDQLMVDLSSVALDTLSLGFEVEDPDSADPLNPDMMLLNLNTADNARIALDVIDDAITLVNSTLGELGAYQNRLDYASANLATTVSNYQASESTIRDVDMAAEMVQFTKFQILQQVGVSMLGQANAAPQAVLALLQ
jgi:flagellin